MAETPADIARIFREATPRLGATTDDEGNCMDHLEQIAYEDDELVQWICRHCGAEGEYEKDGD